MPDEFKVNFFHNLAISICIMLYIIILSTDLFYLFANGFNKISTKI